LDARFRFINKPEKLGRVNQVSFLFTVFCLQLFSGNRITDNR
jgi:hypothetical protein